MRFESRRVLAVDGRGPDEPLPREMYLSLLMSLILLFLVTLCSRAHGQSAGVPAPIQVAQTRATASLTGSYGKLPLSFEANQGQSDPRVRFLSHGNGYSLLLTDHEAVLTLRKPDKSTSPVQAYAAKHPPSFRTDVVRMQLAGASSSPRVSGADKLPGFANYFVGSDPKQWRSGVPTYGRVEYSQVYPGVDLVYYGNQRQLEYDFVVAPGASAKQIRLHFEGAKRLRLNNNGDLEVIARNGEIAFRKPVVYQDKDGARRLLEGHFALAANNTIKFELSSYDHSKPLVIDPTLAYSTYLGGSGQGGEGSFDDNGYGIAVDSSGDAYVVGDTWSENFPVTSGSYDPNDPGLADGFFQTSVGFVSKLNATASALVYSTYIGGDGSSSFTGDFVNGGGGDNINAIYLDSSDNAYLTGSTWSQNFPTTSGAFQSSNRAFPYGFNAWVAKLNPAGNQLLYSTLIGGSAQQESNNDYGDSGVAIAVNSSGNAYVTGFTTSTDFPITSGAYQTTNNASTNVGANAWVAEFNSTGTSLVYSTYLGGSGIVSTSNAPARDAGAGIPGDAATGIALDATGDVYVTGYTLSTNFPVTSGSFQTENNAAGNGRTTGFVSEINPAGSALVYSTYLGGSGGSIGDIPLGISLDSQDNAYITGATGSADFPVTQGSFQTSNNGATGNVPNAFITKLSAAGNGLIYSTFLGGNGNSSDGDRAEAIVLDSAGDAYVTGYTCSTNFPVTASAYQSTNNAAASGGANAFFSEINSEGTALIYSTYLGGSRGGSGPVLPAGGDVAFGIALDGSGNAYIVGDTYSSDFPVTPGAFQSTNNGASGGNSNLFISKFNLSGGTATPTAASIAVVSGSEQTTTYGSAFVNPLVVIVKDASGNPVPNATVSFAGTGLTFSSNTVTTGTNGEASVTATPTATGGLTAAASTNGVSSAADFSLTADQAVLTITATSVSVAFNQAIPALTFTASGFVNGDTSSVLSGTPNETTTATQGSAPGSYPIMITQGTLSTANYSFQFVNGTLTITSLGTAATPTFSPGSGAYTSAQSVAISDTTPGATIYYTTNGTSPTTASAEYTANLSVNASETIEAIAVAPGYSQSAVSTATYTINLSPASFTLAASPTTATINAGQSATFTLTVTPENGFTQAVSFSCSGLPSGDNCSFSPQTVTPAGAAVSTTLTIAGSTSTSNEKLRMWQNGGAGLAFALLLWPFLRTRRRGFCAIVLLSLTALATIGCGASHKAQNYTITVTASGGSVTQTTSLSLTVN
jgi:MBG domain (YGX type)/Chitobiase/beta-hexosaminidase C-terminal domain/Bacterial Ig-like domain (group 1)/Beta-propeller repeat